MLLHLFFFFIILYFHIFVNVHAFPAFTKERKLAIISFSSSKWIQFKFTNYKFSKFFGRSRLYLFFCCFFPLDFFLSFLNFFLLFFFKMMRVICGQCDLAVLDEQCFRGLSNLRMLEFWSISGSSAHEKLSR